MGGGEPSIVQGKLFVFQELWGGADNAFLLVIGEEGRPLSEPLQHIYNVQVNKLNF